MCCASIPRYLLERSEDLYPPKDLNNHSSITFNSQKAGKNSNTNQFINRQLRCGISIWSNTAAAANSLQSCPTLCDPIDGSLPGSPIPGILQARTLEWVKNGFFLHTTMSMSLKNSALSEKC